MNKDIILQHEGSFNMFPHVQYVVNCKRLGLQVCHEFKPQIALVQLLACFSCNDVPKSHSKACDYLY